VDHPKHMRERLAHVYWIGGPPDAGKTTVATTLAATYDAQAYFQDRNEMNHIRRAESGKHPLHVDLRQCLEAESPTESFFEPWVRQGPEELAQQSRALWAERIDMICDDLLALEPDRPIIAEGPGFFPEVILPLLSRPNQAIWLVPTVTFKRDSHARRDKGKWRFETSDPERAMEHHIARDVMLAEAVRAEVIALELPWIEIDGIRDSAEIASHVASYFGFSGGR